MSDTHRANESQLPGVRPLSALSAAAVGELHAVASGCGRCETAHIFHLIYGVTSGYCFADTISLTAAERFNESSRCTCIDNREVSSTQMTPQTTAWGLMRTEFWRRSFQELLMIISHISALNSHTKCSAYITTQATGEQASRCV